MERKDRIEAIVGAMDECAVDFCERTCGIHVEITAQYKKDEDADSLQYRRAFVYYHSFTIEFMYTAHAPLGVVNSILGCAVRTDKSASGPSIPLAMLLDYCHVGTSVPLCIPGITDGEGMREAFAWIGGVLEKNLPVLAEILGREDGRERVLTAYCSELSSLYKTVVDENNVESYCDNDYLTLRFCSAAFINYLAGNRATAVKQLRKTRKRLGYEQRTLALWESGEAEVPPCPESIRRGLSTYNKSGVAGSDKREAAAMFLSWLVLAVAFSIPYLGVFFLRLAIESKGTIYLMGPMYNLPYCFLAGFLTAIPASYFTRYGFYRRLFPKHYEQFRANDQVNNGKGADKLIKGLLHVIVVCSLAGTVLFAGWGIRFREDSFVDNADFFSLVGTRHEYADIERVYYRPDRVNGFGETLDYPSYVLVLKDGREIDLYEYDDVENYEGMLLDHLIEKGGPVEREGGGSN